MGLRSLVATKSLLPSSKASKVHSDFLNLHFATFDKPAPGLQGQIPPHHSFLLPSRPCPSSLHSSSPAPALLTSSSSLVSVLLSFSVLCWSLPRLPLPFYFPATSLCLHRASLPCVLFLHLCFMFFFILCCHHSLCLFLNNLLLSPDFLGPLWLSPNACPSLPFGRLLATASSPFSLLLLFLLLTSTPPPIFHCSFPPSSLPSSLSPYPQTPLCLPLSPFPSSLHLPSPAPPLVSYSLCRRP